MRLMKGKHEVKQPLAVGRYKIGMAVPADIKLSELTQEEYAAMSARVDGQNLYHAQTRLVGFAWMVIVGAVNNTVLSLRATTLTETLSETIQAITLVQQSYSEELGVPEERQPKNAFCLWRSSNAQVTYQVSPLWPYRHEICITGIRSRF